MDDQSLVAGLLGLGTSVAGAIPSVLPGPNEGRLERAASGQGGAGTLAMRRGTDAAARNAIATAGSGRGATRGLAINQALRESDNIRARGAEASASMAAREQQAGISQLEQVRQRRLQALLRLGAAGGQALGSFGATQAVASSPAPAQPVAGSGPVQPMAQQPLRQPAPQQATPTSAPAAPAGASAGQAPTAAAPAPEAAPAATMEFTPEQATMANILALAESLPPEQRPRFLQSFMGLDNITVPAPPGR